MLKDKEIVSFYKIFRWFLKDKLNLFIILGAFLCQVFIYFFFYYKPVFSLFPNKDIQAGFYNDSIDGGNSIIRKCTRTDSTLAMDFVLKQGFVRPYVGISLQSKSNQYFDVSAYNQVLIEGESNEINNIVIHLITRNKAQFKGYSRFNDLYFSNTIELAPVKKTFKININRFKTPDWWFDINNLSPSQHFSPDLKHVNNMDLATGLTPTVDIKRSLVVYRVSFERNNAQTIITMGCIEMLIIFVMFWLFYLKSKPIKKQKEIIINYKPVTIDNPKELSENYLNYINQNFQDSELILNKIVGATGISKRIITDGIAKQFNCNVKTYINQIRINEAKRLLKETDLHISEIAYNVGFNSPSNFNRVFKNLTGKSPSEFLFSKE